MENSVTIAVENICSPSAGPEKKDKCITGNYNNVLCLCRKTTKLSWASRILTWENRVHFPQYTLRFCVHLYHALRTRGFHRHADQRNGGRFFVDAWWLENTSMWFLPIWTAGVREFKTPFHESFILR